MPVDAEHGVALEVSDSGPVLSSWRSLCDGLLTGQTPSRVIATVAFTALLLGAAEMSVECASTPLVAPDVTIDGLVTDGEHPEPAEPATDLFRAEVLTEPHLNEPPVGSSEALVTTRAGAPASRLLLGGGGPVGTVLPGVAPDLARDRTSMPTQGPCDGSGSKSLFPESGQFISLTWGELVVSAQGPPPSSRREGSSAASQLTSTWAADPVTRFVALTL